jgi:hypothetical protein
VTFTPLPAATARAALSVEAGNRTVMATIGSSVVLVSGSALSSASVWSVVS